MVSNIIKKNEKAQAGNHELNILKETFPQCFDKDGRFDKEAFLSALPDGLEVTDETSGFNWLGKNYARMLYNMDSTTVICPDKEHNALPENRDSQNVYKIQRKDGQEALFIVIESKGYDNNSGLSEDEKSKIACAKQLYEKMSEEGIDVKFEKQLNTQQVMDIINQLTS